LSLFVRLGAFFFYMGVVAALLSMLLITVLALLGSIAGPLFSQQAYDLLSKYATLFALSSATGALLGLLSGKVLGAFIPGISQVAGVGFILTHFLPVYTPLTTIISMTINLLPLPPPVVAGMVSTAYTVVAFALLSYLAYRVGALPAI